MFVDSHCHIHSTEFYADSRDAVYDRARKDDVTLICVGTDEADSREAVAFTQEREGAYAVVGVHPHEARHGWASIEEAVRRSPGSLVGIGEIGLDYYYTHSPREQQIQAFEAQLQLAVTYNLPVSFHVRDAFDDFWPIFDSFQGVRGVLHSFTDDYNNMKKGLTRNLFIGVNGISTFTKDLEQQEMYDAIPLENMLLETDAPFLTPKPLRGSMNEPSYVRHVAEYHAQRRGEAVEVVAGITTKNARHLFALP